MVKLSGRSDRVSQQQCPITCSRYSSINRALRSRTAWSVVLSWATRSKSSASKATTSLLWIAISSPIAVWISFRNSIFTGILAFDKGSAHFQFSYVRQQPCRRRVAFFTLDSCVHTHAKRYAPSMPPALSERQGGRIPPRDRSAQSLPFCTIPVAG